MKHVGKMKNNSARLAIVYRTLPGDPHSALVVGTQGLGDSYHDTLMNLIESDNAQQANATNQMNGLLGLGAAGLMSPKGTFSGLGSLFGGSGAGAYGATGMDAASLAEIGLL